MIRSIFIFLISLIASLLISRSSLAEPLPFDYDNYLWTKFYHNFQIPPQAAEGAVRQKLGIILQQANLSLLDRYIAQRHTAYLSRDPQEAFTLLSRMSIRTDDFQSRFLLEKYRPDLTEQDRYRRSHAILEEAITAKMKSTVSTIAYELASYLMSQWDFINALEIIKLGLSIFPATDQSLDRLFLLDAMAVIYEEPYNSREVIKKGIAIHDEIEALYLQSGYVELSQMVSFNKGAAKIRSLGEYRSALQDLAKVDSNHFTRQQANLFAALAALGLSDRKLALEHFRAFDIKKDADYRDRLSYVACLHAVLAYELGLGQDLSACRSVDIKLLPPVELVRMKRQILKRPFPEEFQTYLQEAFENYYFLDLQPFIQKAMGAAVDQIELQKARQEKEFAEVQVKLEQDANQFKNLLITSLLCLVLALVYLFRTIRRKQRELAKLNRYIKVQVLQRFLPSEIIDSIIQGRSRLEEEPQKKFVTVLFCDLVDFTQTADKLGTETSASILNDYFEQVTLRIFACKGTIDKFIGDGVMVIFGAPEDVPPEIQAARALDCGYEVIACIQELNRKWREKTGLDFSIRIGINSGEAIVGSFGSRLRSDYTVIGPTVNLASRIEHIATPNAIFLGPETARLLAPGQASSLGQMTIRGLPQPIEIYQAESPKDMPLSA